ncbi:hypothetical protein B0H10DRAFT_1941666 [Mycena sp. CBHHK59/15]|nr:hypothetical protein B0H10DRAFT_1941666 [Mycena sp. CBHHK59/15]
MSPSDNECARAPTLPLPPPRRPRHKMYAVGEVDVCVGVTKFTARAGKQGVCTGPRLRSVTVLWNECKGWVSARGLASVYIKVSGVRAAQDLACCAAICVDGGGGGGIIQEQRGGGGRIGEARKHAHIALLGSAMHNNVSLLRVGGVWGSGAEEERCSERGGRGRRVEHRGAKEVRQCVGKNWSHRMWKWEGRRRSCAVWGHPHSVWSSC